MQRDCNAAHLCRQAAPATSGYARVAVAGCEGERGGGGCGGEYGVVVA